jgi:integrase
MAGVGKLSALKVKRVRKRGMYGDGNSLYLQISRGGTKSWVLRYKVNGKSRHLGLGPLHAISLAQARERATDARRLLVDGSDPIEAKRASRAAARLEAATAMTFKQCADAYVNAHKAGWRSVKHAAQWKATLATYAEPIIGALSVQVIDTALVMKILEPIWTTKLETASRLRGRIEAVLDWAKAREYRSGENPARWRGHLSKLLPERSKVRKVQHHSALAYAELPVFLVTLREQDGIAARALEFTILTAARTGEGIGAKWSEIDLGKKVWIIPSERMKGSREHRVPLSKRALAILAEMQPFHHGDANAFVFPGMKRGRPLSNMAFLMLLRRMKRDDLTAHGFRSTFRVWVAERTNYPSEVAEAAVAHVVADKVVAAYQRSDFFDRRRRLMDEWAQFCNAPLETGRVVPMRGRGE